MRAWVAFKDTDKSIFFNKEHLDKVNSEVKILRNVFRTLLGYLHNYDINEKQFDFNTLTPVDKHMMVKLYDFSTKLTEAYNSYDLKKVYDELSHFIVNDITNFYLDFIRYRITSN
jgi:isoleucyl-tRNA synthetase